MASSQGTLVSVSYFHKQILEENQTKKEQTALDLAIRLTEMLDPRSPGLRPNSFTFSSPWTWRRPLWVIELNFSSGRPIKLLSFRYRYTLQNYHSQTNSLFVTAASAAAPVVALLCPRSEWLFVVFVTAIIATATAATASLHKSRQPTLSIRLRCLPSASATRAGWERWPSWPSPASAPQCGSN